MTSQSFAIALDQERTIVKPLQMAVKLSHSLDHLPEYFRQKESIIKSILEPVKEKQTVLEVAIKDTEDALRRLLPVERKAGQQLDEKLTFLKKGFVHCNTHRIRPLEQSLRAQQAILNNDFTAQDLFTEKKGFKRQRELFVRFAGQYRIFDPLAFTMLRKDYFPALACYRLQGEKDVFVGDMDVEFDKFLIKPMRVNSCEYKCHMDEQGVSNCFYWHATRQPVHERCAMNGISAYYGLNHIPVNKETQKLLQHIEYTTYGKEELHTTLCWQVEFGSDPIPDNVRTTIIELTGQLKLYLVKEFQGTPKFLWRSLEAPYNVKENWYEWWSDADHQEYVERKKKEKARKVQLAREEELRLRNRDPLLIGYDGLFHYLIAMFDLTPLEEYVATAFAI